jgi:hypothetical protein
MSFDYPEKPKNDKAKRKNEYDLEDLISEDFRQTPDDDEPDDRFPRKTKSFDDSVAGCSAYLSAGMQYPFDGRNVITKLLIGGVLMFIPVIGQLIVSGYSIRVMRRVLRGQRDLPEWNDFGGDLMRGIVPLFGFFFFGVLLMLSMIAVVTIPVVMFLGFPMVAYVLCRYAATDEFGVFFDIFGAYRYVLSNVWAAVSVSLSIFVMSMLWGVAIGFGTAFFILPGLMASFAATVSFAYVAAAWGRTVGMEA